MKLRDPVRKPSDFQGRPLPYALDDDRAHGEKYSTTSGDSFTPRDLKDARPAKLANFDFVGRPLPYARDDGVDEMDVALKPKKKENRFTQGRPIPYALEDVPMGARYSTATAEQFIARDLKQARPAERVTHDQPYNIVTMVTVPVWKDLAF